MRGTIAIHDRTQKTLEQIPFDNTFVKLGADFFQSKSPDPVTDPYLVDFNPEAARLIQIHPGESSREAFVQFFSGSQVLPGSEPLAMVYSGHQFGVYNPRLGDGRGLLLGETRLPNGETWEIHLKGCGPTRFARGFDGRATLRSSIREHLGGEAMHGLGIPTTRSLAVIGIRELIYRERPELAAILVRLSDSHIRFGSFEYFHYTNRPEKVRELADYVLARHFPDIAVEPDRYRLLFRRVILSTAHLLAAWQTAGFVHGVMNTDNMSITGTTFDYGPYAFIDRYNPHFTSNHSDTHGRYALGQQPEIAHWNLGKFGETLIGLVPAEHLQQELEGYQPLFNRLLRERMGKKLAIQVLDEEFTTLAGNLLRYLYETRIDYTNFFRRLADYQVDNRETRFESQGQKSDLETWLAHYQRLLDREDTDPEDRRKEMNRVNPKFILRNYLLEGAITKAIQEGDFSEVERLRILLQDPFRDRPEIFAQYKIDPDVYASDTPDAFIEHQLSCSA